ncbi:MAG TPA: VTT domain-containing protein [Anaerolineaceae bacterium]|nr:VTT domain-containing protein [Anaerolineaceae bacterium]
MPEPKIHLAFRFHGNFYHSYRGDTPDELGFGTDIRIIRNTLHVLDAFNARGVPVRGTWDFENYFSLEKIMPEYCPDLIESMQRRVAAGLDEVEFMSYNNGFINAHNPAEFEHAMSLARSNPQGSGLADLFGENVSNIVRPQEMMYSPIHLKLYNQAGIRAISLYYSAVPFNALSNFIPLLSEEERYNPLTLSYPGIEEKMTLLPAYNIGDLVDHISLKRWLKGMRKAQLKSAQPKDMLLILDQDADDSIWFGYGAPKWVKKIYPDLFGLEGLVESVRDLEFLDFSTPGRYLQNHQPLKEVSFGQDTADGSFDGLASWVEKWSNHQLFTGLERSRLMDLQTQGFASASDVAVQGRLQDTLERRVKILSTTHFGMAAPVMNLAREKTAAALVEQMVALSSSGLQAALPPAPVDGFTLTDYPRGVSNAAIQFEPKPSRQLIQLVLKDAGSIATQSLKSNGEDVEFAILHRESQDLLVFKEFFQPLETKHYQFTKISNKGQRPIGRLEANPAMLTNGLLQLSLDAEGQISGFSASEQNHNPFNSAVTAVKYGGKQYPISRWEITLAEVFGPLARLNRQGAITLPGGYQATVKQEFLLVEGLPYLYFWTHLQLPRTPDKGFNRGKAQRLQQAWDVRWQELTPFEIRPVFEQPDKVQIWKHDYCGQVTHYSPDYSAFTPNQSLASINNHITNAWVAISDGSSGLLLAQNTDYMANVAFCPIRSIHGRNGLEYRLNPFGTYTGNQYRYALSKTGLGRFLATRVAPAGQLDPLAPSYNGRSLSFMLMLAPYEGAAPGENLQADAQAFAYPAAFNGDEKLLNLPSHRGWQPTGSGENPDGLGPGNAYLTGNSNGINKVPDKQESINTTSIIGEEAEPAAIVPTRKQKPAPKPLKPIWRILMLVFVLAVTVALFILREKLQSLQNYGYAGIFVFSIAANATIILPVPGVAFTTAMGAIFTPWKVALAAGTGAAIGELTGYAAGFSGEGFISNNKFYTKLLNWMQSHPKWAFGMIILLAFIPNPLMDVAGMVSGVLRIPAWKYLLACAIGKIGKMMLFAYAGRLSFNLFEAK